MHHCEPPLNLVAHSVQEQCHYLTDGDDSFWCLVYILATINYFLRKSLGCCPCSCVHSHPKVTGGVLLSCAVVFCALPCCAVALQILGVHLGRRGLPLAPDVQVAEIAAMTMGFTGADLANLVNEVCLLLFRTESACGLPVLGQRRSGSGAKKNEMHTVQYMWEGIPNLGTSQRAKGS